MKRYGNLFASIACEKNIEIALANASQGKKDYEEVKDVYKDEGYFLKQIKEMLDEKTYVCSPYVMFVKTDRDKERDIAKLPFFPDRIIQHAILQVTEPIWKASLINQTYQSIKGRGVHSCLAKVTKAVQEDKVKYCLQIDVKKFYPSIDTGILKKVVRRKIKCKDTLWLLDVIIDGSEGIPIGNYISQYFGNLFLSRLDHSIKEMFKIKSYFRYCDDVLVMSNDKEELWRILKFIEGHFKDINLRVKENHQLYQIGDRGVSCLGYIVYRDRVDLKRNIIENFSKKIHKMERAKRVDMKSLGSYYGWFKHCDSYGLWIKLTDRLSKNVSRVDAILLNKLTTKLKYKSGVANAYRKKQHKAKPTSEASRKASSECSG